MAQLPKLTRDKIALFAGSPENARAIEALFGGLSPVPDQIATIDAAVLVAQATAEGAQDSADAAQADATAGLADAASAQADIDAHQAATSAHGVSGAIVGTTDAQILSAKTLDGPIPMTGQTVGTGTATPTLTANKPGSNAGVSAWLTLNINGTAYYLPLWT